MRKRTVEERRAEIERRYDQQKPERTLRTQRDRGQAHRSIGALSCAALRPRAARRRRWPRGSGHTAKPPSLGIRSTRRGRCIDRSIAGRRGWITARGMRSSGGLRRIPGDTAPAPSASFCSWLKRNMPSSAPKQSGPSPGPTRRWRRRIRAGAGNGSARRGPRRVQAVPEGGPNRKECRCGRPLAPAQRRRTTGT